MPQELYFLVHITKTLTFIGMGGLRLYNELHLCKEYAVQVYLVSITKYTAYFVEKLVVSNLTHATLPDGELYIFVKQQTVTLDCHIQIQYLPEVCSMYR